MFQYTSIAVSIALYSYYLDTNSDEASIIWNVLYGLSIGIGDGILLCALYGVVFALAKYIAGTPAAVMSSYFGLIGVYVTYCSLIHDLEFTTSLLIAASTGICGYYFSYLRALIIYPFHAFYNITILRYSEYRNNYNLLVANAAFWDEYAISPQVALHEQILLAAKNNYLFALNITERLSRHERYLSNSFREFELHRIESCNSPESIARISSNIIHHSLFIDNHIQYFRTLSADVGVAVENKNSFTKRLIIKDIQNRLSQFQANLSINKDTSSRLNHIAFGWSCILDDYSASIEQCRINNSHILNPYIIAVPLLSNHPIFTGRQEIAYSIERLVLSDVHSPLLLHGPRRIGKTSLLNNLQVMLPSNIVPLFVDLQGSLSNATSNSSFLYRLSREIIKSASQTRSIKLPEYSRQMFDNDPFNAFDECLDTVEMVLDEMNGVALITFDELEALHSALLRKTHLVASEILGAIRHIIQHRNLFRILFATSFVSDPSSAGLWPVRS